MSTGSRQRLSRHFPGEVIVHLRGDDTRRTRIPASSGTPDNPLSTADITRKFQSNASRVLPAAAAQTLASTIAALEEVSDITDIVRACATTDPH